MYKILQLLFVGLLLSQTNDQTNCNDGDWHYIMPNFMEELELLLSGEFDLQDSSKFIDGLVNEPREHQSWKISHDVYFSQIKDNITNELSNFLNPNYFTIYYKSRQLRHMSNYFEDLEEKTNFYDLDNIKKYIEETYCVDNGNGSHYTVSSPYGSASFSKDQGIVIHVVFNYNQQSILDLQNQYAGHQSENKIYENFDLNQFTRQSLIRGEVELGYLKEHFIDGFTIQFGAPFFDISILFLALIL